MIGDTPYRSEGEREVSEDHGLGEEGSEGGAPRKGGEWWRQPNPDG
jgi:hypothetical protein